MSKEEVIYSSPERFVSTFEYIQRAFEEEIDEIRAAIAQTISYRDTSNGRKRSELQQQLKDYESVLQHYKEQFIYLVQQERKRDVH